jgi:regulatory protein
MKILRYEKRKNGMYQVLFDNDYDVDLHEEIILKHNLLIKKEASQKEIDEMLEENKKFIAYDLSVKFLAKKMRSTKETREYLFKNEFDKDTIDYVINTLIKEKYLNDNSYSKAYINDKILLSNDGPNKIKNKLIELGVNKEIIDSNLELFTDNLQKEKIDKIISKQITTNRNKSALILKNKITEYLYNLGYDKSIILDCLNKTTIKDNKDIMKKEYDKVFKKLSKKYSGTELEYKVKQKMYSLGFDIRDE